VLGAVLIVAFFAHSWRAEAPLIDVRTFARSRAGAAAGVFLLFAISVFGTMLLTPLYYQSVRHESALAAGLLMAPGGFGAMMMMPVSGRLTDRYGPTWMPVTGLPLVVIGLIPFAFVGPHTSFVLLCSFNFIQGLGMGFAMMPTMTAAMQAVPRSAIARTSTAMNIVRQGGASIGTAILSVILASAISDNLKGTSAGHTAAAGAGGLSGIQHLSAKAQAAIAQPLAHSFATTFIWALVLVAVALVPALTLALMSQRSHDVAAPRAEVPLVME
jgi:MFS family permease